MTIGPDAAGDADAASSTPSAGRPADPSSSTPVRPVVVGITVLALVGLGWFLLSWQVMHTAAGDAGGEAFGVVFALLIIVSVVGAIRSARRGAH